MANNIIRNGLIVANEWTFIPQVVNINACEGKVILPLAIWQQHYQTLNARQQTPGLWLSSDENPADFPEDLKKLPLIAIHFPAFTDGRGFSLGNLLRERFGYQGQLRAHGHFIRDQLFYLKRCGFNEFQFEPAVNLDEAVKSLKDFSDSYQIAADQPTPLFRRR